MTEHRWHALGRPCGAKPDESEGITEHEDHVNCPGCLAIKKLGKCERDLELIIEVAQKHGWNGIENSKILYVFLDRALTDGERRAEEAETLFRERNGEVWIWSTGDPEDGDNADTIVCPILVQPDTFRELWHAAHGDPIPVVIHCPRCGTQHIDYPETEGEWRLRYEEGIKRGVSVSKLMRWENPPHKSHKCRNPDCGTIWRTAGVPTTGVATLERGSDDNWPVLPPYTAGQSFGLEELKRAPQIKDSLKGRKVRIWSAEHGLWWRAGGSGYTSEERDSGLYEFDDAYARSSHAGPEKRIAYILV